MCDDREKPTVKLKVLGRGVLDEKRVDLLIGFTSMRSEPVICALKDYLVQGYELETAAMLNFVDYKNLKKSLGRLEDLEAEIEKLKIHDGVTKLTPEEMVIILTHRGLKNE